MILPRDQLLLIAAPIPNRARRIMIQILTLGDAAKVLQCSTATVSRAAHSVGVGYVAGARLMGFNKTDLPKLRPAIHKTAGNPDWIARARRRKRQ